MDRREFLTALSGLTANYVAAPFALSSERREAPSTAPPRGSGDLVDSEALAQQHLSRLMETAFSVSIRNTLHRLGPDSTQVSKAITREVTDVGSGVEFATRYRVRGDLPIGSLLYVGLLGSEDKDRYVCSEMKYERKPTENDSTVRSSNPDFHRDIREGYTALDDIRGLFRGANWLTHRTSGTDVQWVGYQKNYNSPGAGFRPVRLVGAVRPDGQFESFRARFRRIVPDTEHEQIDQDVLTCVVAFETVGTEQVSKPEWCAEATEPDWR